MGLSHTVSKINGDFSCPLLKGFPLELGIGTRDKKSKWWGYRATKEVWRYLRFRSAIARAPPIPGVHLTLTLTPMPGPGNGGPWEWWAGTISSAVWIQYTNVTDTGRQQRPRLCIASHSEECSTAAWKLNHKQASVSKKHCTFLYPTVYTWTATRRQSSKLCGNIH